MNNENLNACTLLSYLIGRVVDTYATDFEKLKREEELSQIQQLPTSLEMNLCSGISERKGVK